MFYEPFLFLIELFRKKLTTEKRKGLLLAVFLLSFAALQVVASASSVSRNITVNDSLVVVRIDVLLDDESYYVIEDVYPSSLVLNASGDFSVVVAGHAKFVTLDAHNTSLFYYLDLPLDNETYYWGGEYIIQGMVLSREIAGDTNLTIYKISEPAEPEPPEPEPLHNESIEISNMDTSLSDAGAGLGAFLDLVTQPMVAMVLGLSVAGMIGVLLGRK